MQRRQFFVACMKLKGLKYLDTTYLKVIYNSNNNVKLLLIVKRQFVDVLAWVCRSDHA